jgi:tetratricopeptide (TPR) repeat protein
VSGWEALIRCLFVNQQWEQAAEQARQAVHHTAGKPLFLYYLSAIYLASGKTKDGLLQLEKALQLAPKLLKQFVELNPSILQNQQVVDLIARNKRK